MAQHYSNTARESDPHALPDIEVFHVNEGELVDLDCEPLPAGWYWWFCFPGCMPDSEPCGPFQTEAEAVADMRSE